MKTSLNHSIPFYRKTLSISLALAAPLIFAGNALAIGLNEITALTIKNSPQIMTAGIDVKLKGADVDIAHKLFGPKIESSYTNTNSGGFGYPKELESLSLASLTGGAVPSPSFLPDNIRTEDFNLALKNIFTNGIYTELGVSFSQRDAEKDRLNASAAVAALNNGGMGASINDYFPVTAGVLKFVIRVPLWGRGDLAEAIGDYESKKLRYEAAMANMNHAISSTLANAVYAYWDNQAAVSKYQLRKESVERVERWVAKVDEVINGMPNPAGVRTQFATDLNRIDGFMKEKRKDLTNAKTDLDQSRANLANAIGVPLSKAVSMGDATDAPPDPNSINTSLVDAKAWHDRALSSRLDIQALKLEDKAADEFLMWMTDYAKPELNVIAALHQQRANFGNGSNGSLSNIWSAANSPSGHLGTTIGLQMNWILDKTAAKGRITQATLNKMKNKISLDGTIRKVEVDLKGLADKVSGTLNTVQAATQSAKAYQESVKAAQTDKSQTFAAVFRQLEIERDWINAEADRINALATLGKVVVEVRHQTATLVERTDDSSQVKLGDIVTLPAK
ncbi:TolC family protein [Propionivibrio sp.]|uniref:TolC family protein n=1 Tax=Propionivibrio sp. TaxID=2212460 RepID=UPI003BF09148